MGIYKGFTTVAWLRQRSRQERGGKREKPVLDFDRSQPDALALCAESWLESLRARNYSPLTVTARETGLRLFMQWAAERDVTRAGEVTRPILETYQRWLSQYEPASGKSKGRRLGWNAQRERLIALKGWFQWLTRRNMILHNPASELELPRIEKRLPVHGLTLSEIERLRSIFDVTDLLGIRDRAMMEVFYATAIRRAELGRLELTDVSPERGTVTVRQGKGKKDRVVPLGAVAAYWFNKYVREVRPRLLLDGRQQALFLTAYGEAFNPDVISYRVSDWLKAAGVPKGSCHLLRHTCATHMLEGGADIRYVQALLGHENLETTAIYTQVVIRQLLEVHARCHPAGRLPPDAPKPTGKEAELADEAAAL
jgi:integrase/recombinase XerD